MNLGRMTLFVGVAACFSTCRTVVNNSPEGSKLTAASDWTAGYRGSVAEYDPGPKKDSLWIPMFGSVPNYRKIGKEYTGSEKFRWNVGPMWYRGRLGENQVKVVIVGQEGAQDENTSNRTFTGGTGTKTQNMLKALEMDRSYLFLNTFVYTIFGQRDLEDEKYMALEQGPESKITRYRHQLFDYTAQYNKDTLSMFLAVGGGGKDSLVTWIESRAGDDACKRSGSSSSDVNQCDTKNLKIRVQKQMEGTNDSECMSNPPLEYQSVVPGVCYTDQFVSLTNNTLVLGVAHPGMARFEGGLEKVQKSFEYAGRKIKTFASNNEGWLKGNATPDTGSREDIISNFSNFRYRNSPVPFRDFFFGTTKRLGDGGTNTSRHGQDAIAIRAKGEPYGEKGRHNKRLLGKANRNAASENYGRPWEPARWDLSNPEFARSFDYGPCGYTDPGESCELSIAMASWPNFWKLDPAPLQHKSFGLGANYRGDVNKPSMIILADQAGHDDFFVGRALTGDLGQRLQTYLKDKGYDNTDSDDSNNYLILRTLPVDTLGMSNVDVESIALNSKVSKARVNIFNIVKDRAGDSAKYMTLGSVANKVAAELSGQLSVSFENISVDQVKDLNLTDIPKADMPYSTRFFMGTSGTRATADSGKYYRFQAPYWVTKARIPSDD